MMPPRMVIEQEAPSLLLVSFSSDFRRSRVYQRETSWDYETQSLAARCQLSDKKLDQLGMACFSLPLPMP